MVQLSHLYITNGKTIALTVWTFVGKVIVDLFFPLSVFGIMETVIHFIFLDSKITADGDCSHEIKRCLFLGRKAMTNLDGALKNRHYFANKGPYSQSYGSSSSHIWM